MTCWRRIKCRRDIEGGTKAMSSIDIATPSLATLRVEGSEEEDPNKSLRDDRAVVGALLLLSERRFLPVQDRVEVEGSGMGSWELGIRE